MLRSPPTDREPPIFPTLKGSHFPTPRDKPRAERQRESTLTGSDALAGAFSGGAAPGYFVNPLRGSDADRAAAFFRSPKARRYSERGRRYVGEVNSPLQQRLARSVF